MDINGLVKEHLRQAEECIVAAQETANLGLNKASANRSYYAILNAIRAILAKSCFDSKKHSALISQFRQRYIKTGIFDSRFSDVIRDAFEARNSSDYATFYEISDIEVAEHLANAKEFVGVVTEYLTDIFAKS